MNPNLKYYEYTPKDCKKLNHAFSSVFVLHDLIPLSIFFKAQGILTTINSIAKNKKEEKDTFKAVILSENIHQYILFFLDEEAREFKSIASCIETEKSQFSEWHDVLKELYDQLKSKEPLHPLYKTLPPRDNLSPRAG